MNIDTSTGTIQLSIMDFVSISDFSCTSFKRRAANKSLSPLLDGAEVTLAKNLFASVTSDAGTMGKVVLIRRKSQRYPNLTKVDQSRSIHQGYLEECAHNPTMKHKLDHEDHSVYFRTYSPVASSFQSTNRRITPIARGLTFRKGGTECTCVKVCAVRSSKPQSLSVEPGGKTT